MNRRGIGAGTRLGVRFGLAACCCVLLAQCGQGPSRLDPKYGVSASPRLVALGESVPKGGGVYRVGKPYTVAGRVYTPEENVNYTAEGLASWYGEDFHGRATANGEVFDMASISAAHPTLPIPSYARVTNLANNRSIIVRVNDRGPYHQNRLIDVSVRTARLLGFYDLGVTRVRVDYVGRAALEGSDDAKLEATLRHGTPAPGPSEVRVASARPFLPQIEPVNAVPLPADRPYELGQEDSEGRTASRRSVPEVASVIRRPISPVGTSPKPVQSRMAEATPPQENAQPPSGTGESDRWERGFAARFAPAKNLPSPPSQAEPVSAFAGSEPPNGALMTGRGLY